MSALLEALEGFARLERVLAFVRGSDAAGAAPTPLDGLGALAALVSLEADAWDAALAEGEVATRRRWGQRVERGRLDGDARRSVAALYWRWGWDAPRDEEARAWLQRAWELFAHVLASPFPPRDPPWGGAPWTPDLRRAAAQALLCAHRDAAHAALEAGALSRARLHWHLLAAWGHLGDPGAVAAFRQRLVRDWIGIAQGLVSEGLERGLERGYERALERLLEALPLEPDAADLHREITSLGARSLMGRFAVGDGLGFTRGVGQVAPSAAWLRAHPRAVPEDNPELRERLAQVWVCAAACTDLPEEAVDALRCALALHPLHPTARRLLGQALAARAARGLGAGRAEAARIDALEARAIGVDPSPAWARLLRALHLPPAPATDEQPL